MPDHTLMKLGKKAPRVDTRTLRLAKYLKDELADPPASLSWLGSVEDWGMMDNDTLGDCTVAAAPGHALQVASINVTGAADDTEVTLADDEILGCYERWAGYVPGDSSTDNGAVIIDILNNWRKDPVHGHHLKAFAVPDSGNLKHVKQCIQLFGMVDIGLALPITAQNQAVWDAVGDGSGDSAPGSWGGHSVIVAAYDDAEETFTCITWGSRQKMTYKFWETYCDESYGLILGWWVRHHTTPSGFDYDQLIADVAAVSQ